MCRVTFALAALGALALLALAAPHRVVRAQDPGSAWVTQVEASFARPRPSAVTIVVTTTADAGGGSLRQALLDAPPGASIIFASDVFPSAEPQTITIAIGELPAITQGGIALDGSGAGVVLDGNSVAGWAAGLRVTSNGNAIKGLRMVGFCDGIVIEGGAQNNTVGGSTPAERNVIAGQTRSGVLILGTGTMSNVVSGNYIGTDITGSRVISCTAAGVRIYEGASYNRIGGSSPGERNVVSGYQLHEGNIVVGGVSSDHNVISGNYVGSDATGMKLLSQNYGIRIENGPRYTLIGGTNPGERNLVNSGQLELVIVGAETMSTTVVGNWFGLDATGAAPLGGGSLYSGSPYTRVGGGAPAERNVFAHVALNGPNARYGVIKGNYIGTTISGTAAIDTGSGVAVSLGFGAQHNVVGGANATPGDACTGDCNLIAGTGGPRVDVRDPDTAHITVTGNYLGTDATGQRALTSTGTGILVEFGAHDCRIGGTSLAERNVIVGADDSCITIQHVGTRNIVVRGNYIGLDVNGTRALSTRGWGIAVQLGASDNLIGGSTPSERNVVAGHEVEIGIHGSGTDRNRVQGNYIGTDVTGMIALGRGYGLRVESGPRDTLVGGTASGQRNLISGNAGTGVSIVSADTVNTTIIGNWIGVNSMGTAPLSNSNGIAIGGAYTRVGGPTAGEGNVISGNRGDGVSIEGQAAISNTLTGNLIGLDPSGALSWGNGSHGVSIRAPRNRVGGMLSGERNVVSGGLVGLSLAGENATGNSILGNYIGTDISGTRPLANSIAGIELVDGARRNRISGNSVAASGMAQVHIVGIGSDENILRGNLLGTDFTGQVILGGTWGVYVESGATRNLIGGTAPGEGNLIRGHGANGVLVVGSGTLTNTICRNAIYQNSGLGIELLDEGNRELSAPVIDQLNLAAGSVGGTACAGCLIEVFSDNEDEGRLYEGVTTAGPNGRWALNKGTALAGPFVTATATDAYGNTSEFSSVASPLPTPTPPVPPTPTPTPVIVCQVSSSAARVYRIEPSAFQGYMGRSASECALIRVTVPPAPAGWNQPALDLDQRWIPAANVWWDVWGQPGWRPQPAGAAVIGLLGEGGAPEGLDGATYLYRQTFVIRAPEPRRHVQRAVLEMWSDNKTEWWWQGRSVSYGREGPIGQVELYPGLVGARGGSYVLAVQNSNDTMGTFNPLGSAYRLCVTWGYDEGQQLVLLPLIER